MSGCNLILASFMLADFRLLMNKKLFQKVFHFSWNNKGLLNMNKLVKLLPDLIPENDFDSLKIPFYCRVRNLDE
jgi:hypothetical protein